MLTEDRIRAIHSDEEYELCLRQIDHLLDDPTDEAQERLEVLSILADAWEREHHEIPPPDPIEALKFIMEQRGLQPHDLQAMIGSRGRVSEVLNGKRRLSLAMIRSLARGLMVPADILLGP